MGFRGAFLNETFLTCTTVCNDFSAAFLKSGASKAVFATLRNGALVVNVLVLFKKVVSSKNNMSAPKVTIPLNNDVAKMVPIFFIFLLYVVYLTLKLRYM